MLQLLGWEVVLRRLRTASGSLGSSRGRLLAEPGPRMVTGKKRNRCPSFSGRPLRLCSHLETRVVRPSWSEIWF